jgi:hypothetical protein
VSCESVWLRQPACSMELAIARNTEFKATHLEADAKIENHNRLQLAAAAMHVRMHVVMQHTSLLCTRACAHPARINCMHGWIVDMTGELGGRSTHRTLITHSMNANSPPNPTASWLGDAMPTGDQCAGR